MIKVSDIARAIEDYAPLNLQENWDNSGLQVGHRDAQVVAVLCSVDVTPAVVDEAIALGANMIVAHHPLIFKGLKNLTAENEVQLAVENAIRNGIAIYSSHTSLDNAENGVSVMMAERIGAKVLAPLVPTAPNADTGTGVVAVLPTPVTPEHFIALAKNAFGTPTARCSNPTLCAPKISRVALCGGAGGSFIEDAVRAGAEAYVTGDIRYHDFVDNGKRILLVDCGHFETESLTRGAFRDIISQKFPELSVYISKSENNPVKYL